MKKNIVQLVFIISLSVTLFSCSKSGDDGGSTISAPSVNDATYGTDSKQKFDLYLPPNRSTASTKSIILIHGGAWQEGDKSDFYSNLSDIKVLFPDYAIFNINYRLYTNGSNLFPTQENDVKAAVDYIVAHEAEYKISDKFVLLGVSAGGHLAMLQAYKYSSPKIKAVVNFFGPSDMSAMYTNPASPLVPTAVAQLFNGTPSTQAQLYFQSSPINFVNAQSPPTIMLQGGVDPLVSPSQQTALKTKLDASSVVNSYVFYPNEGHGWGEPTLTDSYTKIKIFITANVQ